VPDTPRTLAAILALFPDNTTGDISPQDLRDFAVSVATPVADGGFGGVLATAYATADALHSPTPSTPTQVDDLLATVGPFSADTLVIVDVTVTFICANQRRFRIYVDSTQTFPVAGGGIVDTNSVSDYSGDGNRRVAYFSGVPITVPGDGATHDISVTFEAQATTADCTFKDRALVVRSSGAPVPPRALYVPDFPPTSPNANDDEFDDASLNAAWSEWDPGSVLTVTEGGTGVKLVNAAASLTAGGIYQALPSGDWSITTKVHTTRNNASNVWPGILIGEDLSGSPSTSDFYTFGPAYGGSGPEISLAQWSSYTSFSSTAGGISEKVHAAYFRVCKSGTTYTFSWSPDGIAWTMIGSPGSLAWTPAHIGLGLVTDHGNAVQIESHFRFWRQVASGVWYDQLLGR
jgi:hypothetical protein